MKIMYQLLKLEIGLIPQEISMILQKMKKTAKDYLGQRCNKAVITVPSIFRDAREQLPMEAGKIGCKVERIINELKCQCINMDWIKKKRTKIIVFDLGGEHFDISILEIGDRYLKLNQLMVMIHI